MDKVKLIKCEHLDYKITASGYICRSCGRTLWVH